MNGLVDAATLAADVLKCSRVKVYSMAKAGEIPHVRVGRALRFDPDAVVETLTAKPRPWAQSPRSLRRKRAA